MRLKPALASLALGPLIALGAAGVVPSHAAAAYRVTATPSSHTATVGSPVSVTGTVTPKAAGKPVLVQQVVRGKWKTIGSSTLSPTSTYTASVRPGAVGDQRYRVCKTAERRVAVGCSATVEVEAFQWRNLYDQASVSGSSYDKADPLAINGVDYKRSFSFGTSYRGGTRAVEFNLSRRCTAMRATLGISDRSDTGATGSFEIFLDGTSRLSRAYTLGQSEPVEVDVTDGLRIKLEATTSRARFYPGVGTPQVYCSDTGD